MSNNDRYEALLNREKVWTPKDIGTNAIAGIVTSAAVSSGRLRGMDALPQPQPTLIRRVKPSEFDTYLRSLDHVLDRFAINQTLGAAAIEGAPMLSALDARETESFLDLISATERIIPETMTAKRMHADRATHRRLLAAHAPALDTVPQIFFDTNFKLGNPTTFSAVFEKADFTKLTLADVNLTSTLIQDKLGVFCDTVDVYLVKEISKRSASFFNALSTLQALHLETQSCIAQIHTLRARLAAVTATTIHPGLNVARLHTRRSNVSKLHDGIETIYKVQTSLTVIDAFISGKQFVDAMDVIEEGIGMLEALVGKDLVVKWISSNAGAETDAPVMAGNTTVADAGASSAPKTETTDPPNLMHHLYRELSKKSGLLSDQMEQEFVDLLLTEVREIADAMKNAGENLIAPCLFGTDTAKWVRNMVRRKRGDDTLSSPVSVNAGVKTESASASGESLVEDVLMSRLMPLVFGLVRVDRFGSALQKYREALMKEIKVLSKKHYPVPPAEIGTGAITSPVSPTSPTGKKEMQLILAKQLKQMSFDSFIDLIITIYTLLLHIFQKSSSVHGIISVLIRKAEEQGIHVGKSATLSDTSPNSKQRSTKNALTPIADDDDEFGSGMDLIAIDPTAAMQEEQVKEQEAVDATAFTQMVAESLDVLLGISEAANARCAKLLNVRCDQNAKLSPKDFYRLLGATREFIGASEFLCGYHCISLKGALVSQAKQFLNHFHDERTKQIAIVIENEQWTRAEVPIDFQHMSEEIVSRGRVAAVEIKKANLARQDSQTANANSGSGGASGAGVAGYNDDDDTDLSALVISQKEAAMAASEDELVMSGRALKVDGSMYSVAGCVLLLTKMLTEYLQCAESLPTQSVEVLNKTLDLLKVYNSRICQVILGAGATKSAGLKNINAGHIALTAQSLGAVIGYIPHLKAAIERHVPAKQHGLLTDFDRMLKDYKEHQVALYDKLVNIMQERLAYHSKNLLTVNWDSPDTKDMTPDQACSIHMAGLIKETCTMHRVLVKFLPKDVLQNVMGQIFRVYNKGLDEELKKVELYTSAGKNRLLMDGQHLMAELSALDNIDGPGNAIEVAINNIKIRDKRTLSMSGSSQAVDMTGAGSLGGNTAPAAGAMAGKAGNAAGTPVAKSKNLFSKWKE
ncbi:Vps54-like protein-domain-containing protein [Chytriomyces cf. hyalinus JEL632]|nr:Vps54-like protein-domain-containing protein [Chytriomyces cf. hyalinus JEL632]